MGPRARTGWELLAHIQHVMGTQPEVAWAVRRLSLLDQLELTLELMHAWHAAEPRLPSNVIPFRPRRRG